ncbi:MAG: nickel pincer cofactor biosynthesis protein LarC [Gemmatales bacterium]
MRIAHFDCFSGISGDMTLGALIGAGVPVEVIRDGLMSLQLPIVLEVEEVLRSCFAATYVTIKAPDDQPQRFLKDIKQIIDRGKLTPKAKQLAHTIFQRLGEVEAAAHGMSIDQVHFHEVGAIDSIADIVGSAIGLDYLNIDEFTARSVPTGHGTIKAAHGIMPVPTPATAALLKGAPLAASPIKTELTTPTGAAILTTVVSRWLESPVMTIDKIGYGAGTKDFAEQPNVLRLFIGTAGEATASCGYEQDQVWLLETNLDDVPGEVIGYCFELLFAAGALDVFTVPIQMKKQRPGVILSVLADDQHVAALETILFRETATLGVRRTRIERHKLYRQAHQVDTPWGPIEGKLGWKQGEKPIFTPEFEECARIARQEQLPLLMIYREVQQGYENGLNSPK